MQRLELTLPTAAENVALDEALLDAGEAAEPDWEVLRLWEPSQPMIVVGRSSRASTEVYEPACRQANVPILRRSSGGAAIVAGPGCLMYSLVLSYRLRPELKDIGRAHGYVLDRLADSLRPQVTKLGHVERAGTSDLVLGDRAGTRRKFSGNSMRAKRTHLLYHGTLMYDFDATLIVRYLRMPPRQPDYRASRSHADFVMNLPLGRQQLVEAIDRAFPAAGPLIDWPKALTARLVRERFSQESWNFEFR